MKFDFDDLKELREETPLESELAPDQLVLAIVQVREPGYVPPGIHVRSRIDDKLFTAEFPAGRLIDLRADERVASVELSRRLKQID